MLISVICSFSKRPPQLLAVLMYCRLLIHVHIPNALSSCWSVYLCQWIGRQQSNAFLSNTFVLSSGVHFINVSRKAFMSPYPPKVQKRLMEWQYFFWLSGSARVKAARKMLIKLPPSLSMTKACQRVWRWRSIVTLTKSFCPSSYDCKLSRWEGSLSSGGSRAICSRIIASDEAEFSRSWKKIHLKCKEIIELSLQSIWRNWLPGKFQNEYTLKMSHGKEEIKSFRNCNSWFPQLYCFKWIF